MKHRPITVSEYHRMAEIDILRAGERVELLNGLLIEMSPIGISHWDRHAAIVEYLVGAFGPLAKVAGQISIPLGAENEPQPDIAVLARLPYGEMRRLATPAEIYALVEIADSSLEKDTGPKGALYARFGIADYLVVDIAADELLHFSRPAAGTYETVERLAYGDRFALRDLPGVELLADRFLAER